MTKRVHQLTKWLTTRDLPQYVVMLLIIAGTVLRFYNLAGTVQFYGDQGRDAIIVREMLLDGDLVFIGPMSSVGGMFLGPFYYYFMLPFFALSYPSPMGPVYAVAGLGVLTIWLLYIVAKRVFSESVAVVAALLYTFTNTYIEQTRFSWNPNPAPFVSLLLFWFVWKARQGQWKWWIVAAFTFGILIQLHYVSLLAGGAAGIFWLIELIGVIQHKKRQLGEFLKYSAGSIGAFLLTLTPLVLFDLKHHFLNSKGLLAMITGKEGHFGGERTLDMILRESHGRAMHLFFDSTIVTQRQLNTGLLIALIALVIVTLYTYKKHKSFVAPFTQLIVWLAIAVTGLSLYSGDVYDHYLSFLFPLVTLLLSVILMKLWQTVLLRPAVMLFVAWYLLMNFTQYHFQTLDLSLRDMKQVSDEIAERVQADEKYNVMLIGPSRDYQAMNYRYFLGNTSVPPQTPQNYHDIETLFIVDEISAYPDLPDLDQIESHELRQFPVKLIREEWTTAAGPRVYVLRK